MHKNKVKKLLLLFTTAFLVLGSAMTIWAATRLDTVSDLYWDEEDDKTVAVWEEVEDRNQYLVYLYRDDSKVAEIKTKKTEYNFKSKMMVEGDYTFRVKALGKGKSLLDSNWSDYSDSVYISADYIEFLKNGGKIDTKNSGPGATGGDSQGTGAVGAVGTWQQNSNGWWYKNADGSYPVSNWMQDPATGAWYFFNDQGYMVTGWFDYNGNRYYCNESGAMLSGSQTIDGVTYQFNESGALIAN